MMKTFATVLGYLGLSCASAAVAWYLPWGPSEAEREAVEQRMDDLDERVRAARVEAWQWAEDARQFRDADRRAAAFDAMHAALDAPSDDRNLTGLLAVAEMKDVIAEFGGGFDPLRPRLRELTTSPDIAVRSAAVAALAAGGPSPADVDVAVAVIEGMERELATRLARALVQLADGAVTGEVSAVLRDLLESSDKGARKSVYSALGGARVDDAMADAIVDLAHSWTYGEAEDVIYSAASRILDKNEDIVDLLVDRIAKDDIAIYGLTFGIAPDQHARVSDALVDIVETRAPSKRWRQCLEALGRYGSARHATRLDNVAMSLALEDDDAARVLAAMAAISARNP